MSAFAVELLGEGNWPTLEADWDTFCAIESEIGGAENKGLDARWRCGQMLLRYESKRGRGGSELADAIRRLSGEFGISETELYDRRQFADEYPEFSNASENFNSWRDVLGALGRRKSVHFSSETPEWSTPQELFDVLDNEFRFELDVCATEENAKCDRYFTAEQDGLAQEWEGTCWMNPPYGDVISAWVQKAWEQSDLGDALVVCLLPARVDTAWWWDYCRFGEIRFLRGRLKFGGAENSAPFPSAVVVFQRPPQTLWWESWQTA